MKKMIFGLAALASLATLATTVESSNTFGVLKLMSPDKETIISVPWLKVGASSSEATGIPANELVLTSNLKNGDKLFAYDKNDGKYYTWTLQNGSWVTTTSTVSEESTEAKGAADVTLLRGVGLILDRCGTGWTAAELDNTPIYLYGQYAELTAGSAKSTVVRSADKMVTTIIAPPTTAEVNLNSVGITGWQVGDTIEVTLGNTYKLLTRNEVPTWCVQVTDTTVTPNRTYWGTTSNATIPAGKGALYHAVKGSGDVTITWNPSES